MSEDVTKTAIRVPLDHLIPGSASFGELFKVIEPILGTPSDIDKDEESEEGEVYWFEYEEAEFLGNKDHWYADVLLCKTAPPYEVKPLRMTLAELTEKIEEAAATFAADPAVCMVVRHTWYNGTDEPV